jgi:hypothetical protein
MRKLLSIPQTIDKMLQKYIEDETNRLNALKLYYVKTNLLQNKLDFSAIPKRSSIRTAMQSKVIKKTLSNIP